jgi:universal stress protein A
MIALQHILVATDFGEAAGDALIYGRELARALGATLHVAHVYEGVADRGIGVAYFENPGDVQHEIEESARRRIDALLTDGDRRDLAGRPVLLESSDPATAIVNHATNAGVDLIVMGTRGRTGVSHLLMGSVAEKVVRLARCPVLTVRHRDHEIRFPDAVSLGLRATQGGSL